MGWCSLKLLLNALKSSVELVHFFLNFQASKGGGWGRFQYPWKFGIAISHTYIPNQKAGPKI